MGEKTGNTVKLIYDFPTEGVLEVCIKGNWYRATSKEFRSFDGTRRITQPIKQPGIGDNFNEVEMKTFTYTGPIYMYDTNIAVQAENLEQITSSRYLEKISKISASRN